MFWGTVKSLKFIGKTMVFNDLEVACANGKGTKKTSKMTPNSIRNSMKTDQQIMFFLKLFIGPPFSYYFLTFSKKC